ncbi:MAG: hypothetical protein OEZ01_10305 [Candidatus Heimdallarchaeota archaeon]|nr:hypothetical protein [Candidatus Heimdallarchaeota archaeon]
METNKATQENIQEQYVPKQQYSSHSYYTEEDRLRDELREQKDKIKKLEAEQRDDRIFKAINEFKSEVNIKFSKLDSKIDNNKKDLETKIDNNKKDLEIIKSTMVNQEKLNDKLDNVKLSNRIWVIGGTLTTLIGIIIAVFTAFAKHWIGV